MVLEFSKVSLRNAMILSFFIFLLFLAYDFITKPANYEDCVLTFLKSDGSRFAVELIDDVCQKKFGSQ